MIENIIKKINNKSIVINYDYRKYIISIKDCEKADKKDFYINNFELRQCSKKTLKPKYDMPPFSCYSPLKNFINERINIICKNSLYIMLIEKLENNEEREQNDEDINSNENEDSDEEEDNCEYKIKNKNYINKKLKIKIQNCKYDKYDNSYSNSCLIL